MATALAGLRPGEGRLAGAHWAEIQPASPPPAPTAELKKAVVRAGRALEERRTAVTLRNYAVLLLALGKTDRAVSLLSKAAELSPANAIIWSDLAAAHLQQSAARSDPYEIVLALSAANRAVRQDPSLLAARFNRALALEYLSLRNDAQAEWRLLLRSERDPLWSREGETRFTGLARAMILPDWNADLKAMEQAAEQGHEGRAREIVASSPQRFREHAEGVLLPSWANEASEKRLNRARFIGEALITIDGDPMVADTIAQVDLLRGAEPRRLQRLAAGIVEYAKGLALTQEGDFSRALSRFQAAQELLAEQGSPFAAWAVYQSGYCLYQLLDYGKARASLLALPKNPAWQRYKAAQGMAHALLGLMDTIEGNPTASLSAYESALTYFTSLDEKPNMARIGSLIASALDSLGQRTEAWRRLHPALIDPGTLGQPKVRSIACEVASFMAREQGEIEIALGFRGELLRNAYAARAVVEALRGRVGLLAALGRPSEAARDLAQAWLVLKRIPDPESRKSLEGDLLLAEAELAGATSPKKAIAALDRVIPMFRSSSYRYRIVEALERRALAEEVLGRFDDVERDLSAAILESELQREKIETLEERIAFLDRSREILDRMILFQLERRHRPLEALRFSEQAKARVLWDWILADSQVEPRSRRLENLQPGRVDLKLLLHDLPEGVVLLNYVVLPSATIIWVLRRGEEPKVESVEVGADALADFVRRFHLSLTAGRQTEFKRISIQLYDSLIAPVASTLIPGERLVLVPDGPLHALSFAVLRNGQTGRYLAQDHVASVAPSLRVFEASSRRGESFTHQPATKVIVFADPEFDRDLYGSLTRLEAVETEKAVVETFPGSRVLLGRVATRRVFLSSAGDFEIVHFGGHSVVNSQFPLLSQMLFTNDPEDASRGVLYSGDILGRRFRRTRLVVLASCSTAIGKISRTEGVESLARPFLAAGVPAVVASLWDVDDQESSEFFALFYEKLGKHFDVALALQATQLEALEQGAQPESWGAFEVIGGSVTTALERH